MFNIDDSQRLTNPCVVLCGVEDYSLSKDASTWPNLNGVKVDVRNMIKLWKFMYNYQNTFVSFKKTGPKTDDINDNINNGDKMNNKMAFSDFLVFIRATINVNQCNDGLIFYYSGHGVKII